MSIGYSRLYINYVDEQRVIIGVFMAKNLRIFKVASASRLWAKAQMSKSKLQLAICTLVGDNRVLRNVVAVMTEVGLDHAVVMIM